MSEFQRPTLSSLVAQARADFRSRLSTDFFKHASVLNILGTMLAGMVHGLYGYVSWLAGQLFVVTATGDNLVRHASVWGLARNAASPASGLVTFSASAAATVPAGTQLQRQDGAVFEVTTEIDLEGGDTDVAVTAVLSGTSGNTLAGASLTLISPISNVSSSAVVVSISGGSAEESDEALRARILSRIRNPPQGGSRSDYERWTIEVPQVTRAWIYPAWSGPGTVGVTFVCDDRDDVIPTEDDVEAVAAHIDALRPVTAEVIAFAPTAVPLNPVIGLTPDTPEVRAAVTAQLDDLLARDGTPTGVTLLLSRIREAISLASGETDHVLASPTANVVYAAGEMPTLGTIDWTP